MQQYATTGTQSVVAPFFPYPRSFFALCPGCSSRPLGHGNTYLRPERKASGLAGVAQEVPQGGGGGPGELPCVVFLCCFLLLGRGVYYFMILAVKFVESGVCKM